MIFKVQFNRKITDTLSVNWSLDFEAEDEVGGIMKCVRLSDAMYVESEKLVKKYGAAIEKKLPVPQDIVEHMEKNDGGYCKIHNKPMVKGKYGLYCHDCFVAKKEGKK